MVSPAGLLTRALGSLTQPVFANGKLKAALKLAKAEQEEAKIAFRQAILEAGQEVNDALATRQYTQRAIKQISQQVEKLTDVLDTTEKRMRYDSEVNYLQVLLARQSLLEARLSLLSHRYELLESTIQRRIEKSSFKSTSSRSAIFNIHARSGWEEFVHHLLTVEGLTPSCSASHLLVRFFSTRTNLILFTSSIR